MKGVAFLPIIDNNKRKRIYDKYQGICDICGRKLQNVDSGNLDSYATVDHIIPKSRGGTNRDDNLRLLCRRCNMLRGNDYSALEIDVKTQILIDKHIYRKERRRKCRNATIKKKSKYKQIAGYCNRYIGLYCIDIDDKNNEFPVRIRRDSVSHRRRDAKHLTNRRIRRLKPKMIDEVDYEDYGLGKNVSNYRKHFNYDNYVW